MEPLKINKIEYVVPLCSQNIKQDCRYDTELFTRYRASCKYENSIIRYLEYLERKRESQKKILRLRLRRVVHKINLIQL